MRRSEWVRRLRGAHGSGWVGWVRRRGDQGYVTAEAAVVIPTLVALTGLLTWGLMAAAAQIRCVDAARAGARAAARGEGAGDVVRVSRAAAPKGAEVRVSRGGGMVRVRVTVERPRFPVRLTAEAAASDEETVGSGGP
ncbi:TadE family type IV pilus minor pilin [Streptomyces sp. CA2R106]|uniref:TadE family type IV pilus minor pilin n=1 Tax=Streptomyces sp. CA2R106 TaxID=3120153 RepID=UPI00300871ED